MDEPAGRERRIRSARALVDLALDFADRAQAVEAALIGEFRDLAAALAAELGPVVIENDEDERLLLRSDGVLAGEVLDEDTGSWSQVESPEEVAGYYDPTDLFLDLADALLERFPELQGEFPELGGRADGRTGDGTDWPADAPSPGEPDVLPWDAGAPPPAGEASEDRSASSPGHDAPATDEMLENLHASGVLSDEQYALLRRQFGR